MQVKKLDKVLDKVKKVENSHTGNGKRSVARGVTKGWAISLSLAAVVTFAAPAQAENKFLEVSSAAFDLVFVRPLRVGRVAMGCLFFIPAAVFAEVPMIIGPGSVEGAKEVFEIFVGEPFQEAFMTPLGEFPDG